MNQTEYLKQAYGDLRDFVAIDTVSAQGRNLERGADFVTKLLEAEGFTVKRYQGQFAPVLVAEAGSGPRTMLIYNHYDVQPETPLELWESPPFEVTERTDHDGVVRLHARGVSDDKGEIIVRLAALRALKARHGGQLPLKIKWLLEGEEEIGSPSLEKFVHDHAAELKADGCWWEFGGIDASNRPVLIGGLKGIICLELRAKVAQSDLHSSYGAVVDNPLWRLAKAVASLRDENGKILIPGFYDDVRAPSSADLESVAGVPDESSAFKKAYGITHMLENASGARFYERYCLEPVINVNGFHGGYGDAGSKTVLPAEGFVKLDFRLVPDQDPAKIMMLLKKHLESIGLSDIEVLELETSEFAARSDLNDPFMKTAIATARDVFGVEPVVEPSSGGSGPMHPFVQHIGVPCVCAGISNVKSFVHAPNENIVKAHFEKGFEFALEFFERVAKM
jgi:acetylornithine deacetylase/succinyl-diaminopimelate desuccinylase-like protein